MLDNSFLVMIFQIIALLGSVIIHEYMHGWMALRLGDPTAENSGRLSLNPLAHLDPIGSVLLPLLLILTQAGFVFGWAKPVPYNPYNLTDRKWGEAKVAIAGPLGNLIIAIFFGLIIRFIPITNELVYIFLFIIVQVNLVLMIFNLVPIPPLDGSKILFAILPPSATNVRIWLERYGFFILIIFILYLFPVISPIISFLFKLITGI